MLAFYRDSHGTLRQAGHFATGGTGTGAGLGNQGALALCGNQRYLFALNAGSNDLSVFRIHRGGLELLDRAAEEGVTPASAISSFAIDRSGHLNLLQSRAAEENRPTDHAVSQDGKLLYTLSGGDHSIGICRVGKAGGLQKLGSLAYLPAGVTGLVVR